MTDELFELIEIALDFASNGSQKAQDWIDSLPEEIWDEFINILLD